MNARRVVREAWRSLLASRQRSALGLLGITVGIGSVIAMVSIGASARAEAEAQFRELGTDLFVVRLLAREVLEQDASPLAASQPIVVGAPREAAPASWRRAVSMGTRERLETLEALARSTGVVSAAAPVAFLQGTPTHHGKALGVAQALGVPEGFFEVSRARAERGRLLTRLDAGRRFCVVGRNVAASLAAAGVTEPVGADLTIGDRVYTVVGALAPAPRTRLTPYVVDDGVLVPIEIATRASSETVTFAIGRLDPGAELPAAIQRIKSTLETQGAPAMVDSAGELVEQMERQTRLFSLLLGAIGAISLIVGGIGVMNVMLSSVNERKREIGLLRALGARRGTVQAIFVAESLLLGVAGGSCGVALGVVAARLVCGFSKWPFQLSLGGVVLGVGLAVAIAVFFGWFPARQAARIHPMTVLR